MSWGVISPARIDFSDPQAPAAPDYVDRYHSSSGAWGQARHVFLGGNGLPDRWAGRPMFVILEAGFGLGTNFLATWAAWRADPQRPRQLWFVSIERHPSRREDLTTALRACPEPGLAAELLARWPPLTPDLHVIDFERGQVRLLLALGDIARVLPELVLQADAFYLDGFRPTFNPEMWSDRVLRGLHRLAAPGATLATWSVAATMRRGLVSAGFEVHKAPGFGAKREMTVARFAPRVRAAAPAGRLPLVMHSPGIALQVAVIGAGLAGAAAAHALAAQGLAVQVFERHDDAAAEASGQSAGLFHGVVHGQDGAHARWLRIAALHLARELAPRLACDGLAGAMPGLWRGESRLSLAAMRALLARQRLPDDFVQAHAQALPNGANAWLYPQGGWVSPPALVAAWLATSGVQVRYGVFVDALHPLPTGGWHLWGPDGKLLAQVDAVVLANALDLQRLAPSGIADTWRLRATRAHASLLPPSSETGMPDLPLPITDRGYVLRLADGSLLCGSAADDFDRKAQDSSRADDQAHDLATLARLTGWPVPADLARTPLAGRTGWRLASADRMPVVGPLPQADLQRSALRLDQPRLVPRQPGLYVLSALGSRGLLHATLGGQVLASWLTGAPMPAPSSLLDAIDPARFVARAARRPSDD